MRKSYDRRSISRLPYNSVKIQITKLKDKYNLVRMSVDQRRPNPDAAMTKDFLYIYTILS
jgi:hypothetical protein